MYQVGNYQKFVISSATGRAYTMLRQIEWCYSDFGNLLHVSDTCKGVVIHITPKLIEDNLLNYIIDNNIRMSFLNVWH